MRLIDADALKRKSQKVATEAWKLRIKATVEVILNQFIDYIDAAPTIKPEPQWIPCSERLPERRKHYIVTDFGSVEEAYYNCDGHWFSVDGNKLKDVTAWMPLPKPYDGGIG